jgi:hypothetical protein
VQEDEARGRGEVETRKRSQGQRLGEALVLWAGQFSPHTPVAEVPRRRFFAVPGGAAQP